MKGVMANPHLIAQKSERDKKDFNEKEIKRLLDLGKREKFKPIGFTIGFLLQYF